MKRRYLALIPITGLALALLAVATHGQQAPRLAAKQVAIRGLAAGDVNTFDPAYSNTSQDAPIMTGVMEGLVQNPPGEISTNFLPALAERWEVSPDGRTYTFHLRRGVNFHGNYGPFTAADVEFSLNRYRDAKESIWAAQYANIAGVQAVDPYTVRVTLKAADPFFLGKVATDTESGSLMLSKKAFEQNGKQAMRLHPIGTGPFKFEEYRTKDRVVLSRNDNYWGGKPILEQVLYRYMPSASARELAVVAGEIHSMRASIDAKLIERLKRQGLIIDTFGPEISWMLHLNLTRKPLDDVRVRRAIAHAIKKEDLAGFMGRDLAEPIASIIPASYFGGLKTEEMPTNLRYAYDPAQARKLLAEAGLPNGFELSMIISERSDYREMMTIIQQQLKQVGINVQLNLVDHTTYHAQGMKDVNPMFLIGDLSYPEAGLMLKRFYHSLFIVGKPTGVRNYSHYDSKQVDAWLEEAERTGDLNKRKQLYAEIQKQAMQDVPVVPVVATKQPSARRPELDLGYTLKSSLVLETRFTKDTRILQR
ncbi:MAG: ABC transporter substrate-binding protein [Candidatus Methylomirabilales bacterium]